MAPRQQLRPVHRTRAGFLPLPNLWVRPRRSWRTRPPVPDALFPCAADGPTPPSPPHLVPHFPSACLDFPGARVGARDKCLCRAGAAPVRRCQDRRPGARSCHVIASPPPSAGRLYGKAARRSDVKRIRGPDARGDREGSMEDRFDKLVVVADRRRVGSQRNVGSVREAAECLIGIHWPRPRARASRGGASLPSGPRRRDRAGGRPAGVHGGGGRGRDPDR